MNIINGEVIGYHVEWYTKSGLTKSQLGFALLVSGFDQGMINDISWEGAFSRACQELSRDRIIRKLDESRELIAFQFTKEALEGGKFEYSYEATVYLNPGTGEITCPQNEDLASHAKDVLDRKIHARTSSDITGIVKRILKKDADIFQFTPKGGTYFVSAKHIETILKLKKFFDEIGGVFSALPYIKGDQLSSGALCQALKEGLDRKLSEMRDAAQQWSEATREDTKQRWSDRMDELELEIEAFSSVLGRHAQQLKQELNQVYLDQMGATT